MIIQVNINTLLLGILTIVCIVALLYFIMTLIKIGKLVDKINNSIDKNKLKLENTIENVSVISENFKDISNVAVETTADAIVLKEGLFDKAEIIKEIINIISSVFLKK